MSPSRVSQLATSIAENTAIVTKFLEENGHPELSFELGDQSRLLIKDPRVEAARLAAVEATQELHDLMQTPQEYIMGFLDSGVVSLQAIAQFKMGHTFPIGQTATYEQIASNVGLPTSTTKRLVRQAMTRNFFVEPENGVVAHTVMSAALVESPALADHVCASLGEVWKSAAHTVDNLIMHPFSEEPNHTELDNYPERAKRFAGTMASLGQSPDARITHMVTGYSWADLNDGLVVDIGGSRAELSKATADAYPQLSFVNQDLEHVIAAAAPIPEKYAGRIKMMAHDFFEPQPVQNADLYFFWSDKYAIKILQNLIPALKKGARIVIAEIVMPAYGTMPKAIEKRSRDMDVGMLHLFNSKERDMNEWKALFKQADARFRLNKATCPPGSRLWMMELIWEP